MNQERAVLLRDIRECLSADTELKEEFEQHAMRLGIDCGRIWMHLGLSGKGEIPPDLFDDLLEYLHELNTCAQNREAEEFAAQRTDPSSYHI